MAIFYSAIGFIAILMISVVFHEFGHAFASRRFGVPVKQFAVGMGKVLWKHTGKNGTVYSFRLLPLGGFCEMDDEIFDQKPRWQRAVILAMGCFNNLLLAFVPFNLVVFIRAGVDGLKSSMTLIWSLITGCITGIPAIFHPTADTVAGPGELVTTIADMSRGLNAWQVMALVFAGLTAINIIFAIFNLLPIPSIDGGQILFLGIDYVLEKITGHGIPRRVLQGINTLFFAVIMGYSIILLFADFWLPYVRK